MLRRLLLDLGALLLLVALGTLLNVVGSRIPPNSSEALILRFFEGVLITGGVTSAMVLAAHEVFELASLVFKRGRPLPAEVAPGDKIRQATDRLLEGSKEIDSIIREIHNQLREKQEALELLSKRNQSLTEEEEALKKRVEVWKGTRPETAEVVEEMMRRLIDQAERSHRRRDYRLFAAGLLIGAFGSPIVSLFMEPYYHRFFHR